VRLYRRMKNILLAAARIWLGYSVSALGAGKAAGTAKQFPLIGEWSEIGYADAAGKLHKTEFGEEIVFRPNGTFVEAAQGMTLDGNTYTYQPPDGYVINWNYGDARHTQRVKFKLEGNILSLVAGDLDSNQDPGKESKVAIKLRRVRQ
jgi:hypothetical protein